MTSLGLPPIRPREAYAVTGRRLLTRKTPVRSLSAVELATVRIDLAKPAPDLDEDSFNVLVVLARILHMWELFPDDHPRARLSGNACAERFAEFVSPWHTRPLSVWAGWDALLKLDRDDAYGVRVTVCGVDDGRVRLRERVPE